MIQHYILFDLDGTLTDPKEGITKAVEYALNRYGITVKSRDELECFIGPPLAQSFIDYYGFDEKEAFKAVDVYREYFTDTGIFENKVYDGIPKLLELLKSQGKFVMMATSKPKVFAKRIADRFDLTKYFDDIEGSELDGTRVNKTEVIKYLLDKHKINASDCVMVGDTKFDIESANLLGLYSVAVTYGYGDRQSLEKSKPDLIADSVTDLINEMEKK